MHNNMAEEGIFYASAGMLKLKLPQGKWWTNIAPLGEKPLWTVTNGPASPVSKDGLIFGYTWDQIQRMQQKEATPC